MKLIQQFPFHVANNKINIKLFSNVGVFSSAYKLHLLRLDLQIMRITLGAGK